MFSKEMGLTDKYQCEDQKPHQLREDRRSTQICSWLDLSSEQERGRGLLQWGSAKTLRSASLHTEFELEHPTEQDKPPLLKAPSKAEIPAALPWDLSLKPAHPHLKTLALATLVSVSTPKAAEPCNSPHYKLRLSHLATLSPTYFAFVLFRQATGFLPVKTASTRTYPLPLFWTLFFSDTKHSWSLKPQLVLKVQLLNAKSAKQTKKLMILCILFQCKTSLTDQEKKKKENPSSPAQFLITSTHCKETAGHVIKDTAHKIYQAGCHPVTHAVLLLSPRS